MRLSSLVIPLAVAASLQALPALGADTPAHTFTNPVDIKWEPAPPNLPKGAKVAVLYGDPSKPGPYVVRLMTPASYKIPAHWHPGAENLTVISGTFYLGFGEKVEPAKAHALKAGGFHQVPAKTPHFAFTKGPVVLQAHGEGPFETVYVNEADDPSKAAKKK